MAKVGKLSMADMRKLINKRAGMTVAHNLNEENPTEVTDWIPTGSRWLDSIICKGKLAGIPVGKVTEIAGLEATGKSFLAAQVAASSASHIEQRSRRSACRRFPGSTQQQRRLQAPC